MTGVGGEYCKGEAAFIEWANTERDKNLTGTSTNKRLVIEDLVVNGKVSGKTVAFRKLKWHEKVGAKLGVGSASLSKVTNFISVDRSCIGKALDNIHGLIGNYKTLDPTKQKLIQSVQTILIQKEANAINEDYKKLNFDDILEQHQAMLGGSEGDKKWNDPLNEHINRISLLKIKIEKLQTNPLLPENEKVALLKNLEEKLKGLVVLQETLESRLKQEISQQKAPLANEEGIQVESQSFIERIGILNNCNLEKHEKDQIISFANRFLSLDPESHTFKGSQEAKSMPFTKQDIQELTTCISALERYRPEPGEKLAIESFLQDLKIGLIEIKSALEQCHAIFNNKEELMKIALLLDSIIDNDGVNLSKLKEGTKAGEIINLLSDYYWASFPPFGVKIDMTEHLAQFMTADQASEFIANLGKAISLKTYRQLSKEDLEQVQKHTIERLNGYRVINKAKWDNNPPRVNIVGGGPGGLARGIVAATLGASWQVIEKRDREGEGWALEARKNVVKIKIPESIQFLLFSGTIETLLLENKVEIEKEAKLENDLTTTIGSIEEAMATVLSHMEDESGRMVSGRAVDIRTGLDNNKQLVTEIVVKGEDQLEKAGSDIVILTDGAGGIASKVFGDTREILSNQTTMFAINLENCQLGERVGGSFTPPKGQIKFEIAAITGMLGTNAYATLVVSPESSEVIKAKQEEVSKIEDEKERKEAEEALNKWYLDSAVSYMEWEGYKTLNPSKKSLARPFHVTITKAKKPSKIEGDALILRAGDAFVTPDPLSSAGLGTAVATAMQFSDILTSRLHGKEASLICEEHNYASGKAYENLVTNSSVARGMFGLMEHTPLGLLQQFLKRYEMDHNMANGLSIAFQKHQYGGELSKEDIDWLEKTEKYLNNLKLPKDDVTTSANVVYGGKENLLKIIKKIMDSQ